MATVALTAENVDVITASAPVLLIDFWASWCGPCRRFTPTFESVAMRFPDVAFATIDTEAQPELASSFHIMSIPTLMVIREQFVLYAQACALPEAALIDLVEQALVLDLDRVVRSTTPAPPERPSTNDES